VRAIGTLAATTATTAELRPLQGPAAGDGIPTDEGIDGVPAGSGETERGCRDRQDEWYSPPPALFQWDPDFRVIAAAATSIVPVPAAGRADPEGEH
jgi:hypothetical protein